MPRPRALALLLAAVVVVAGCSDDEAEPASPAGSREAFCAELRASIEDHLTIFDPTSPVSPDQTGAALDRLAAAAPPALAESVARLAEAFSDVAAALGGTDPSDPQARAALEALDLDEDAIAAAQADVEAYAVERCSIDLEAVNQASVPTTVPGTSLPPAAATTVPLTTVPG